MGYVGNSPAEKYASFAVQHFTTSATTTYSLTHAVANENDIRLVINNVVQQPGASYAYVASGTTLTLSAATSGTDTMYCVFLGKAVQTVVPPESSITGDMLSDTVISGQLALGATPADTDEFLVSDAGVLKRVDYSYMKASTTDEFRPNAQAIIINGDMAVAQRNASATGLTSSGYNTVDRFKTTLYYTSSNVGTFTQSQSTDVPSGYGFRNSLKMDCTTAQTSLPADGQIAIRHTIEAQNMNPFKFGTSNAEKMTLAFWVKSNLTGTYNVSMYHQDGSSTPQVNSQYSISSANTWEKKVLVIPADTSNAFNDDNGQGLSIDWIMGTGSTYTGGTAPTTWSAFVNNTFNGGSTINMASSTSNEWLITGIQLEVGEYTSATIPPFQLETYADNLSRCQRYYYKYADESENGGNDTTLGITNSFNGGSFDCIIPFPVSMRSKPSIEQNTGSNMWRVYSNNASDTFTALSSGADSNNTESINVQPSSSVSITQGNSGILQTMDSTAYLSFGAEI